MKLLIDIPEHIYEHAKEESEDSRDEFDAMRAIANGTQQESRSEIPNTCDDAISRQAVFEQIGGWIISGEYGFTNATEYLSKRIKALPSVTPQQRTGRWEEYYTFLDPMTPRYRCSICQEPMEKILDGNQLVEWWSDYCPNCGAKMEVENG